MSLLSQSSMIFAQTDLNKQFNYCEMERDQAEKALDLCDESLKDCRNLVTLTEEETETYKKITDTQQTEVVSQKKEIDNLEKSKVTGHILFGVLGIVVGIVLHIPLALIFK